MVFTLTDSQQVTLSVKAIDKKGNPASLDSGFTQWFVDNSDLLSITDLGGGGAVLKAVGPLGAGKVSVKATVNGADVAGFLDVSIVSGAPTQLSIEPGAANEQT